MGAPAKSLVNVQRRFALGLAEILSKHIAEQCTLFDGVVEGDVGMGMRVEPMFGHVANDTPLMLGVTRRIAAISLDDGSLLQR